LPIGIKIAYNKEKQKKREVPKDSSKGRLYFFIDVNLNPAIKRVLNSYLLEKIYETGI